MFEASLLPALPKEHRLLPSSMLPWAPLAPCSAQCFSATSKAPIVFRSTNEFNKGPSKTLRPQLTCRTSGPRACFTIDLFIAAAESAIHHCARTSLQHRAGTRSVVWVTNGMRPSFSIFMKHEILIL